MASHSYYNQDRPFDNQDTHTAYSPPHYSPPAAAHPTALAQPGSHVDQGPSHPQPTSPRSSYYDPYTDHDHDHVKKQTSDGYSGFVVDGYHDSDASLVKHAEPPSGAFGDDAEGRGKLQPMDYAEPTDQAALVQDSEPKSAFARLADKARYPLEQRIEDKKRGIGRQKYPFLVWALTIAMIGVFINELVVNAREQGSPISTKPYINPMIGPSSSALINLGARFPPCMKNVQDVPTSTLLPCLNNTANPPNQACSLEVVCGFGGFHGKAPNQWFRFITPIFVHAGVIHILLNLLAQLTLSAQVEKEMGSGGFIILYMAAGIFGNVLGGNFSLVGVPSVGASGAIFGTSAVAWVDLLAHWKLTYRPGRRLLFLIIELVIGVALGYVPFIDNFAHLGGFLMGLLCAMVFYPIVSQTKRHKTIVWGFRLAAIPFIIILYVVLIRNFYTSDPYAACSGCRYLSCLPTAANNHCKGTGLTTTSTSTN